MIIYLCIFQYYIYKVKSGDLNAIIKALNNFLLHRPPAPQLRNQLPNPAIKTNSVVPEQTNSIYHVGLFQDGAL